MSNLIRQHLEEYNKQMEQSRQNLLLLQGAIQALENLEKAEENDQRVENLDESREDRMGKEL